MKLYKNFLIGMIHLPPLLSYEKFWGMEKTINKALSDLENLQKAGFDAVLIENDYDQPHTEFANPAQIASFAIVANEVMKKAKIPVGVEMMLNDWESSIAIAKAINAEFIRLDVFVDDVICKWCNIYPNPQKIMDYKNKLYPELKIFTDIQVKYKTMIDNRKTIIKSAEQAIYYGSDALIITGNATGEETPIEKIKNVKSNFIDFPVFVGAGVNKNNIRNQLNIADGAIVGTSVKTGDYVDYKKAKELIDLIKNS